LNEKERATYLSEVLSTSQEWRQHAGASGTGATFSSVLFAKMATQMPKILLKMSPAPEHDTYILPGVGLTERVLAEMTLFRHTHRQLHQLMPAPLFHSKILHLEKETHYNKIRR